MTDLEREKLRNAFGKNPERYPSRPVPKSEPKKKGRPPFKKD